TEAPSRTRRPWHDVPGTGQATVDTGGVYWVPLLPPLERDDSQRTPRAPHQPRDVRSHPGAAQGKAAPARPQGPSSRLPVARVRRLCRVPPTVHGQLVSREGGKTVPLLSVQDAGLPTPQQD